MTWYFSVKGTFVFEHDCSSQRVMCHVLLTPKSVSFECVNCHKKIFYRKALELPEEKLHTNWGEIGSTRD
jgi:hypothetical protein